MTNTKILIAAGGTAGHLFPAQQLAEHLEQDCAVVFAGHGLGKSAYFQQNRFRFYEVAAAPFGRRFFGALVLGLAQSIRVLMREKPGVVVGFGSYHTVPVLLASVLLRKKIVLYEANCSLGKVNRLFAPFAKKVAVQFAEKRMGQKQVAVPLFPWKEKQVVERGVALREYGLDENLQTLLVFGGSQGAQFLNETMPNVRWQGQVIHLAGNEAMAKQAAEKYAKAKIKAVVKSFESKMELAYAAADLAVCRSGAGTIGELIRYQIPSLLIPYPYAYGHQELNAKYIEDFGGATVLLQRNATPEVIEAKIASIDLPLMRVALRSADAQNDRLIGLDEVVRRC